MRAAAAAASHARLSVCLIELCDGHRVSGRAETEEDDWFRALNNTLSSPPAESTRHISAPHVTQLPLPLIHSHSVDVQYVCAGSISSSCPVHMSKRPDTVCVCMWMGEWEAKNCEEHITIFTTKCITLSFVKGDVISLHLKTAYKDTITSSAMNSPNLTPQIKL